MFLNASDFDEDEKRRSGPTTPSRSRPASGYSSASASTPTGSYGRHGGYGGYGQRPATTSYGRSAAAEPHATDRPSSTGGLGLAGALPTENRKSMLERQREIQRRRRQARMGGGLMATSRSIDGPDGPRSPMANPQVTRSIPQFSAPRAYVSSKDNDEDNPEETAPPSRSGGYTTGAGARGGYNKESSYNQSSPSGSMSLQEAIREREKAKREQRSSASPMKPMTEVEKDMKRKGLSSTYDPGVSRSTMRESKTGDPVDPDISDIRSFLTQPTPRECGVVQCYIQRHKSGLNKLYPVYHLYMKKGDKFLLAAKKRAKQRTSNYLISMKKGDMSRTSENFLGKLRSNFVGTEFNVYDHGINPKEVDSKAAKNGSVSVREELAMVTYASNVLGSKGPRKMKVCVPRVSDGGKRQVFKPTTATSEMAVSMKANDMSRLVYMINKPPRWNDAVGAYVLNFNGRVTMASVKNFQLVDPEDQEPVLLQFGRVGKDVFTMDYQWPLCPLQAFAIALSSFDYKIACE